MTTFTQKYRCEHTKAYQFNADLLAPVSEWEDETDGMADPGRCPVCDAQVDPEPREFVFINCAHCKMQMGQDDAEEWFNAETGMELDTEEAEDTRYCSKKCLLEGMFAEATPQQQAGILSLVRSLTNIQGADRDLGKLFKKFIPDVQYQLDKLTTKVDTLLEELAARRHADDPAWLNLDFSGYFIPNEEFYDLRHAIGSLAIHFECALLSELERTDHQPYDFYARDYAMRLAKAGRAELIMKNAQRE